MARLHNFSAVDSIKGQNIIALLSVAIFASFTKTPYSAVLVAKNNTKQPCNERVNHADNIPDWYEHSRTFATVIYLNL